MSRERDGIDLPNTEKFTGGCAESDVRPSKMVNGRLRQHGVVLEFRLAEGWTVTSDQDKLG
jgi:hypothetical protein